MSKIINYYYYRNMKKKIEKKLFFHDFEGLFEKKNMPLFLALMKPHFFFKNTLQNHPKIDSFLILFINSY